MSLLERLMSRQTPEEKSESEKAEADRRASQEKTIQRGRLLADFKDSEAGAIVLGELRERRDHAKNMTLAYRKNSHGAGIEFYVNRYQAIDEFLGWLDDEVSAGEKAILEKVSGG